MKPYQETRVNKFNERNENGNKENSRVPDKRSMLSED